MTEIINIGASKHLVPIYERLRKESTVLKEQGIDIELTFRQDGAYQILDCQFVSPDTVSQGIDDESFKICVHQIAEVVAEIIVIWWQPELVQAIMCKKYDNLSNEELDSILQKMFQPSLEKTIYVQFVAAALAWKKEIAHRIALFLEVANVLSIDGFINFRLQDFKWCLNWLMMWWKNIFWKGNTMILLHCCAILSIPKNRG